MSDQERIELTFEVTIEQWADEGQPSPNEDDIQAGLHRCLDGEFDLGAITVRRVG